MTPPSLNTRTNAMPSAFDVSQMDASADHVCELTFDEQRELPMRMQLGLDLTALD